MHTFTGRVTFTPLSRGRYRCNQTGKVVTRKQILAQVSEYLASGRDAAIGVSQPRQSTNVPKQAGHASLPKTKGNRR